MENVDSLYKKFTGTASIGSSRFVEVINAARINLYKQ